MLFSYGRVVTGKQFYDRSKMQKKIQGYLNSSQAFMIKAPRRFGKTSLIKHVLVSNNIDYLYIDFRKTPRIEVINEMLIEFIYAQMGIKGALKQLQKNITSFLIQNKTNVKVNIGLFEASVELLSDVAQTQEEKLSSLLDLAQKVASELGVTFYCVMDEFQDIKKLSSNYDLLELLRGTIQHHENVCYIFAGSHTTMMTEIFESKKSPFYNYCRRVELESFNIEELAREVTEAFKSIKVMFDSHESLLELLKRLKGHPANTMLVLSSLELFVIEDETVIIKQEHIDKAYDEAFDEMSGLINEYLRDIKSKEHLHDVIYRMANNEEQVLEASSLHQKKRYLVDMGYLRREERAEYKIIDGFLEDDLKGMIS